MGTSIGFDDKSSSTTVASFHTSSAACVSITLPSSWITMVSPNNTSTSTRTHRHFRHAAKHNNNASMAEMAEKPDCCDASWTTLETEGTASQLDSCGSLPPQQPSSAAPRRRVVTFAETEQVRQIISAAVDDDNTEPQQLWWRSDEIAAFRASSLAWIQTHAHRTRAVRHATEKLLQAPADDRAARRFLMHMSAAAASSDNHHHNHNEEEDTALSGGCVRGLEHHFVPQLPQMMVDHAAAVLQAQESSHNDARRLRKVAKKHSKPSRELAWRRAQHDRKDAIKAVLTPWE